MGQIPVEENRESATVQEQLGRSLPTTTANMYADISFENTQDGLNGLYE